ncbi:tRNA pseudouridine(55) synthase TruB [bacterium]|nr:tRNA pseudouridine(55) synthase TruB [bacterium]
MNGLLNVLKPPGMTSHDVVYYVRHLVDGKVGHTGTLDPLAAGVLIVTIGAATKLTDYFAGWDKAYRAELILGLETDTLDLEGTVLRRAEDVQLGREQVVRALESLTGILEMEPPMFSAVKHDGRRLYELAREGKQVERKLRTVTVTRFDLLEMWEGEPGSSRSEYPEQGLPRVLCEVECSKGTYVRSLAQMLGERLGCGACLGFLLRTVQGPHRLQHSHTLEEVQALVRRGELAGALTPMTEALPHMPSVSVGASEVTKVQHGNRVPAPPELEPGTMCLVLHEEEAVCLAEVTHRGGSLWLQPKRVFIPEGRTDREA